MEQLFDTNLFNIILVVHHLICGLTRILLSSIPLGSQPVEEVYSVEMLSCRGYVDNKSGFGEEDDNNTGVPAERDDEEMLSVACSKG